MNQSRAIWLPCDFYMAQFLDVNHAYCGIETLCEVFE